MDWNGDTDTDEEWCGLWPALLLWYVMHNVKGKEGDGKEDYINDDG